MFITHNSVTYRVHSERELLDLIKFLTTRAA